MSDGEREPEASAALAVTPAGPLRPLAQASMAVTTARHRAPTLVGARVPGNQGAVQVWYPSRWRIRLGFAATFVVPMVLSLPLWALHLDHLAGCTAVLTTFLLSIGGWSAAYERLPVFTTDEAGIEITTREGCRVLTWTEVRGLRTRLYGEWALRARDPVDLNVCGYSRRQRQALLALICARAELKPDPKQRGGYVRVRRLPGAPIDGAGF